MVKNNQDPEFDIHEYRYAYINLGNKTLKVEVGDISHYVGEGMFKIINHKAVYLVHASNVTFVKD